MWRAALTLSVLFAAVASTSCAARAGCKTDADCEKRTICNDGACVEAMCTQDWRPVCGADGKTYSNSCAARLEHIEVKQQGECAAEREPKVCGTIRGLTCSEGEFCDLRPGVCGGADLDGVCVAKPAKCDATDAPVCGCDGKTYANDCERIRSEIRKSHAGPC